MHTGDEVPLIADTGEMSAALSILSEKGFGCVGIVNGSGELTGIITDGDIRRNLDQDLTSATVTSIMTTTPKTIEIDTLAAEALRIMTAERPKVMQLFVLDNKKPVGILHMHDLLRAGLG